MSEELTQQQDQEQVIVQQGEAQTETVDTADQSSGRDMEAARQAAEQFLAESRGESETSEQQEDRGRDDKGRFLPKVDPVAEESIPAIDPVWIERAKQEGFHEDRIKQFATASDVEDAIALQRVKDLRKFGMDPLELVAFRQWRNGQGRTQAPQQYEETSWAPETSGALELTLNEEELDESVTVPIKQVAEYVNQLNASIDQRIESVLRKARNDDVQQRAAYDQSAQQASQVVTMFDVAAGQLDGFTERLGTPSQIDQVLRNNPNDPKARKFTAFSIAYLQPAIKRYTDALGLTPKAVELAMREAWNESDYSKGVPTTNGVSKQIPASVVRMSSRLGSETEVEDDYSKSLRFATEAFERNGGRNPFNTGS